MSDSPQPRRPHFGFTRRGLPVHESALDHLAPAPGAGAYARFNAWLAVKVTKGVGSMSCAYIFGAIALISLPAAISTHSVIILVSWVAQTFLQLVLLSIIIVGQSVQTQASDARSAKTFEDVEVVIDRLDTGTQGGITEIMTAQQKILDAIAVSQSGERGERLRPRGERT